MVVSHGKRAFESIFHFILYYDGTERSNVPTKEKGSDQMKMGKILRGTKLQPHVGRNAYNVTRLNSARAQAPGTRSLSHAWHDNDRFGGKSSS